MIAKLKEILTNIRQEREEELKKYKSYCGNDKSRYENRRAILLLELPFLTDSVSVLNARAAAYQMQEGERHSLLGIKSEQEITRQKDGILIEKKRERAMSIHSFLEEWVHSGGSSAVSYIVKEELQKRCSEDELTAENLPYLLTFEILEEAIQRKDIDQQTKSFYIDQANNLCAFLMKAYPVSPVLIGRRARLSLCNAAKLFDYMEQRALRSTTEQKYHDVLLCRALFYIPLPTTEFFSLGPPEKSINSLKFQENLFPVPTSFVRLWNGFSPTSNLFLQTFDDRGLHKKIKRLGEYAELTTLSLTPSILRLSGKAAYFNYLSLDDKTVAFLPRR